jgi:hypothetical protein
MAVRIYPKAEIRKVAAKSLPLRTSASQFDNFDLSHPRFFKYKPSFDDLPGQQNSSSTSTKLHSLINF